MKFIKIPQQTTATAKKQQQTNHNVRIKHHMKNSNEII